jgi:hypothetical protein
MPKIRFIYLQMMLTTKERDLPSYRLVYFYDNKYKATINEIEYATIVTILQITIALLNLL